MVLGQPSQIEPGILSRHQEVRASSTRRQLVRVLLPHQMRFVESRNPLLIMRAGLGSGKSMAGCVKLLTKSHQLGPSVPSLVVAQSHDALRRVILATLIRLLDQQGSSWSYNKNEKELTWDGGGPIWMSSGERPELMAGTSVGSVWIDEPGIQAREVLERAAPRMRAGPEELRQTWLTGTPEGLGWFHELCEQDGVEVIQATTRDNTVLGEAYTNHLLSLYPDPLMQRQYIEGIATQMKGSIYSMMRDSHARPCESRKVGSLVCGGDFNVGHMVTVIGVENQRRAPRLHFFKDIVSEGGTTTDRHWRRVAEYLRSQNLAHPQMVEYRGRWQSKLVATNGTGLVRAVIDASGRNRHSSATETDEHHVLEAGFDVVCPTANPMVSDRIATVQAWLGRGDVAWDPEGCKVSLRAFQRHDYKPGSDPPSPRKLWKSGELPCDHYTDACGYVMCEIAPVTLRSGAVYS